MKLKRIMVFLIFLEHMFFKGAERYKDSKAVSGAIDSVGGEFNAFTGKEYAGYYVKVASEKVDTAFDVLSDMMIHAKFDQEEIEKERGSYFWRNIICIKTRRCIRLVGSLRIWFLVDQPLGWDQIGLKEVINTVKHEDFVKYKEKL